MKRGGWNPVIHRRKVGCQRGSRKEGGLVTIFVDNIPESMDPKGLFSLFCKFGIVKDVFILGKRRKASRSRFGFIRYDCEVVVDIAIQKANGLWCDNKALVVKRAEYQKSQTLGPMEQRGLHREALASDGSTERGKVVIKAKEEGNGWQYESVVVKMSSFLAFKDFRSEMCVRGMKDVIARECGGRIVLLTFSSVQHLKEWKAQLGDWGQKWCDSVEE
ncbi:hypothetical protein ACSBR2_020306 [Camellia fascicularis]